MKNKLYRLVFAILLLVGLTACETEESFTVEPPFAYYDLDLDNYATDYPALINKVAIDVARANIVITTSSHKTIGSLVYDTINYYGSGVVISYNPDENYYLALTANHVVAMEDGYNRVTHTIYDYQDYAYEDVEVLDSSAEYDLAVIKFYASEDRLFKMSLSITTDPFYLEVAGQWFTLGTPLSQRNSFTSGKYQFMGDGDLDEPTSSINFDVIYHNAYINSGASGGMLFDESLKLIGINYAIIWDTYDRFQYGLAVPASRIIKFIEGSVALDDYEDELLPIEGQID